MGQAILPIESTWQEALSSYGFEFDAAFYEKHFSGRRNAEIVANLLPHLSVDAGIQLALDKEARFRDRAEALLKPLAGLTELLDWIAARSLDQAIVTNASRKNAEFMLQVLHLQSHFPIIISGEELPRGKPDPLPYKTGLERLQANPTAAIAFEDSASGVQSAVSAGIMTVGIATTHAPETLYQLGAELVIADFSDARLQDLLTQRYELEVKY